MYRIAALKAPLAVLAMLVLPVAYASIMNGFMVPTESCDALSGGAGAACRQSVTEEFGKT